MRRLGTWPEPVNDPVRVFRNRFVITLMWLCTIGSLVGFGLVAFAGPEPNSAAADQLVAAVVGVVFGIGFFRATRLRIEACDEGIRVFNYFATHRLAWNQIVRCTAGYTGIAIETIDGATVNGTAIGKPNWATWLNRSSKADRIADYLNERARGGEADT